MGQPFLSLDRIFCRLILTLFLNLLQVGFFAYQPDDIALFENAGRENVGKVLLTLFQSYNHTVVLVADSALFQRLSQKFAAAADDELV